MKKILILCPALLLAACFDDLPECWDPAAKKLVVNITKKNTRLINPAIGQILEESVDRDAGVRVCSADLITNRITDRLRPKKITYTVTSKRGEDGEYVHVEVFGLGGI